MPKDSNAEAKIAVALLKFVAAVLLIPVGIYVPSAILTYLWDWFVNPVFHVGALSIYQAYGLMIVLGFFMFPTSLKREYKEKTHLYRFGMLMVGYLFVFGMAWVWQALGFFK